MSKTESPARSRITYVVIVKNGEFTQAVYGPYRSFKHAESDAKAWDGTVEPLMKRNPYGQMIK